MLGKLILQSSSLYDVLKTFFRYKPYGVRLRIKLPENSSNHGRDDLATEQIVMDVMESANDNMPEVLHENTSLDKQQLPAELIVTDVTDTMQEQKSNVAATQDSHLQRFRDLEETVLDSLESSFRKRNAATANQSTFIQKLKHYTFSRHAQDQSSASATPQPECSKQKLYAKVMNSLTFITKKDPRFSDNKIIVENVWHRRVRSKVYVYLVPLIFIFYFVPAIQFVFQLKNQEESTGSLDICFHNFKCAKPLGIFSAFNHTISNISYMLLGLGFVLCTYTKTKNVPRKNHPKYDSNAGTGVLQQMSIFYAMGLALVAEGFLSICYHVCPTDMNLQFDTTMMYVMVVLCYVKLYQLRHPDASANSFVMCGLIGILVFFEAATVYIQDFGHVVYTVFYFAFLISYVLFTIFLAFDCYYLGIDRTNCLVFKAVLQDTFCNWKPVEQTDGTNSSLGYLKYPKRFAFASVLLLVNFTYALYLGATFILADHPNSLTQLPLRILGSNMIYFLIYYVLKRNLCHPTESQFIEENRDNTEESAGLLCQCINGFLKRSGSVFGILALVFFSIAVYFFAFVKVYDPNTSPAKSRLLNQDCEFMDFYDNHDLWHFFSGAGIFMTFMALLTIDDDLLFVPRNQIDVF